MVEREDMTNAIALNSTMFNSATAVGPAVAGLTYAALGPAWCFTINGISFLAVIVALLMMQIKPQSLRARATSALADLKEGVHYVASHPTIRMLIIVAAMVSLFGMSYATLLPAWAVDILHGDSTTNGFLQSARGVGSLLGALMIASLGRFRFKGKLLTLGSLVFPISLLAFAAVSWLPLSLLVLVGVGWGFMVMLNMANALVQTLVPDELRGRVMGVYTLGFFGVMPIGALLAGAVAQITNEPITVVLGALITLAFAAWLWVQMPQLRALE
jgi:MFS family permease